MPYSKWEKTLLTLWEIEYLDSNEYNEYDDTEFNKASAEYIKSIREPAKVDYFFLTVNPKPDVKLDLFLKLLGNFVKRKPVVDFVYTIEQRGETESECGKGFHSHILLTWDSSMSSKVRQYSGETFKRIIGSNNNKIININRIPKEFYQDKLDYMNGLKWDSEKESKIKMDLIFREKNNILSLYKKNGSVS